MIRGTQNKKADGTVKYTVLYINNKRTHLVIKYALYVTTPPTRLYPYN